MSSQCLGRIGKSNCIVAGSAELVVRLAAGSLSFSAHVDIDKVSVLPPLESKKRVA